MSRLIGFALFLAMWLAAFNLIVSSLEHALGTLDTAGPAPAKVHASTAQMVQNHSIPEPGGPTRLP